MVFTFIKPMIEKPECKICKKDFSIENPLDSLTNDLLYSLFNPYYRENGKFDPSELIKKHLKDEFRRFDNNPFLKELVKDLGFSNGYWSEQLERYQMAKRRAWEELKDLLRRGEVKREEVSASQIVESFFDEVVEDLKEMGYIDYVEGKFHRRFVRYKAIAEKIIGDKILSIALEELDQRGRGEHLTERGGISIFSGENIVEFDPTLHSFDNID
ncbi:MAG: VWA domain-containing protein, partial [Archaeoglobaceae archaeon]|nr:VWA domain-containing protein [Archaeoglobaceae archaeon]